MQADVYGRVYTIQHSLVGVVAMAGHAGSFDSKDVWTMYCENNED
jgi:hypothetical protein